MLNLESLNERQREAVTFSEKGPALVIAGPGSGKTHVITQRICYLIEEKQIHPEKILVLTFTKEAALSMEHRFVSLASSEHLYLGVSFGTFHSFFYHILLESNLYSQTHFINQTEKRRLLSETLKAFCNRSKTTENSQDQYHLEQETESILQAFGYYKNTLNLEQSVGKVPEKYRNSFLELYYDYEKHRKQLGKMDFDDILSVCYTVLKEQPSIRQFWQKRFDAILLDEFQDINPMQYQILKLLCKEPYSVFAVGDDDQAIYGFRGSDPSCLMLFQKEFGAKRITLEVNYRSVRELVQVSQAVINENHNRFPKKLRSYEEENKLVQNKIRDSKEKPAFAFRRFETQEEMFDYLLEKIQQTRCDGENTDNLPTNRMAVLFRTNGKMQKFAAFLYRHHIPFHMVERMKNPYDHWVIESLLLGLRVICLGQKDLERRDLFKVNEYFGLEVSREWMIQYAQTRNGEGDSQKIDKFLNDLEGLKGLPIYLGVMQLRKRFGLEEMIRRKTAKNMEEQKECFQILEWFTGETKSVNGLQELLLKCEEPRGKGKVSEQKADLELMTAHGSKGLEFDMVWIPFCNEGEYPYGKMLQEDIIEEERRVFYVAMTRAKKNLELLSLTGTKEYPRYPSRFLNPILRLPK